VVEGVIVGQQLIAPSHVGFSTQQFDLLVSEGQVAEDEVSAELVILARLVHLVDLRLQPGPALASGDFALLGARGVQSLEIMCKKGQCASSLLYPPDIVEVAVEVPASHDVQLRVLFSKVEEMLHQADHLGPIILGSGHVQTQEEEVVDETGRRYGLLAIVLKLRFFKQLELVHDLSLVVEVLELMVVLLDEHHAVPVGEVDHVDNALVLEGVDELVRCVLQEDHVLGLEDLHDGLEFGTVLEVALREVPLHEGLVGLHHFLALNALVFVVPALVRVPILQAVRYFFISGFMFVLVVIDILDDGLEDEEVEPRGPLLFLMVRLFFAKPNVVVVLIVLLLPFLLKLILSKQSPMDHSHILPVHRTVPLSLHVLIDILHSPFK
jgi:hypothetical protein